MKVILNSDFFLCHPFFHLLSPHNPKEDACGRAVSSLQPHLTWSSRNCLELRWENWPHQGRKPPALLGPWVNYQRILLGWNSFWGSPTLVKSLHIFKPRTLKGCHSGSGTEGEASNSWVTGGRAQSWTKLASLLGNWPSVVWLSVGFLFWLEFYINGGGTLPKIVREPVRRRWTFQIWSSVNTTFLVLVFWRSAMDSQWPSDGGECQSWELKRQGWEWGPSCWCPSKRLKVRNTQRGGRSASCIRDAL